ncbi:hypothetical protein ACFHWD_16795 [Clostridium sp. MT-14]|jgi:outer membrane biosynthesis protein TonB|uniref:hypothetical protein n=1 Tax=Clostridium sp. MT-14 TaxID=3348360 RepID=UPI0035F4EA75
MKITAEFNSNEELLSFISTFGTKAVTPIQEFKTQKVERTAPKPIEKQQEKKTAPKPIQKAETPKEENKPKIAEQPQEAEKVEVTKEMVRAVFTKLVKAGKAKEAKDLTQKYGANRIPDIKAEDYEAIYKEAKGLI